MITEITGTLAVVLVAVQSVIVGMSIRRARRILRKGELVDTLAAHVMGLNHSALDFYSHISKCSTCASGPMCPVGVILHHDYLGRIDMLKAVQDRITA